MRIPSLLGNWRSGMGKRGWVALVLVALVIESSAALAIPFLRVRAGETTL